MYLNKKQQDEFIKLRRLSRDLAGSLVVFQDRLDEGPLGEFDYPDFCHKWKEVHKTFLAASYQEKLFSHYCQMAGEKPKDNQ